MISGSERSAGEGISYPLQYSDLENSMDYTIHGVAKSQTQQRDFNFTLGFPGGSVGKESVCNVRTAGFNPWVTKIPWRRKWPPIPVFLLGDSYGQRSLVGYIQSMGSQRVGHD